MLEAKQRNTYKRLCDEREAILDEVEVSKQGRSPYHMNQRMGLWNGSTYLDELMYIRMSIEKEMIPHEIIFRMGFYQKLNIKIPMEIILHIASFGDLIDKSAFHFLEKGTETTLDDVASSYLENCDSFVGLLPY